MLFPLQSVGLPRRASRANLPPALSARVRKKRRLPRISFRPINSKAVCSICAPAGSTAFIRVDRSSSFPPRVVAEHQFRGTSVFCWWIAWWYQRNPARRIVDAVEIGYRESGEVIFETTPREGQAPEQLRFSQRFECKSCNIRYEEPEPRLFSFNNPYGACPRCQGFGNTIDFDLDLVIPDKSKTLNEGAIEPWTKPKYRSLLTDLKRFARRRASPGCALERTGSRASAGGH